MSELQVLVTPGQQTIIAPQLGTGSTIFNKSATDAVWISGTPNPSPGIGYKVGGYGSIQWQNTGAAYACVDTGVTSPVSLSVSDHVGNPVNPVDVATAVASQLNLKGIPNVLLGSMVYSGAPTIAGSFTVPVNMSQYGSIVLRLTTTKKTVMDLAWIDSATGAYVLDQSYILNGNAATSTVQIVQSVKADQLRIGLTNVPDSPSISVYASNRILQDSIQGANLSFTSLLNQAFTATVPVDFSGQFVSNGKPLFARFVVTGANTGKLACNTLDAFGTASQLTVIDSTVGVTGNDGKDWTGMLLIPPGVCWFSFIPNVTASYVAKIQLIPSL